MDDRGAEDQRVVHAVLEGDREAFADLVERYQRMVAGVAWRYGVRQQEIEDVVSEVFTKVFRNLHQYRPEHAFSTWLYRLAANHVMDHGRRTRREGPRAEMPEQIEDPTQRPEETVEELERARLLHRALGEVAPHYRETVFLVYIEGMKVEEAARTLGLPQGTIKSRLLRGRDALRRILLRRSPDLFGESDALQ